MKKAKKSKPKFSPCTERDRLWNAFLAAGKDWQSVQAKMATDLRRSGEIDLDVKETQAIQERIERSHRLFAEHIEKHGCSVASAGTDEPEKKSIGKRK